MTQWHTNETQTKFHFLPDKKIKRKTLKIATNRTKLRKTYIHNNTVNLEYTILLP